MPSEFNDKIYDLTGTIKFEKIEKNVGYLKIKATFDNPDSEWDNVTGKLNGTIAFDFTNNQVSEINFNMEENGFSDEEDEKLKVKIITKFSDLSKILK